jgi:hypothetical protein
LVTRKESAMKAWLWPVAAVALVVGMSSTMVACTADNCTDDGICRRPMQATPLDPFAQQRRQSMPRD